MAAETLERISDDCDVDADMLAHHFWQAGDASSTWHYSRRAADGPVRAYANADGRDAARAGARRIVGGCPTITADERFDCWLQLGELRDRAGLLAGALDAYDERRPSRSATIRSLGRELLLRRAHTHERAGSYPIALRSRDDGPGARSTATTAPPPTGAGRTRSRSRPSSGNVRSTSTRRLRLGERAMEEGRRCRRHSAPRPGRAT